MTTNPIPQLGAAMALVQLLKERSGLPPAAWSLDSVSPSLHGYLHEGGLDALRQYAEAMGGSIRPGKDYRYDGRVLRPHRLHSVWQDVAVEITVVLPAPVPVAAPYGCPCGARLPEDCTCGRPMLPPGGGQVATGRTAVTA